MTQGIDVLLKEQRVFPPPKEISEKPILKAWPNMKLCISVL